MLGTGYFLKIAKINLNKKNQSVLIIKISSRKTQKIAKFGSIKEITNQRQDSSQDSSQDSI